jgi:2-polyprenyl-6-hydroxyphenyl methylase/3-demethylubiquinone-9 3-methyltransferase
MSSTAQKTTIDPSEVEKFSAMAEQWWDPNGKFKPLHQLNPTRIAYIRDRVQQHFNSDQSQPLQGLKLLDIGCGGGLLSEPMTRLGASVTAIDASEKNIQIASVHAQQMDLAIDYQTTTVEELAATGAQYDVVLNMEVVEHVADVETFIESSCQLVKPGGLLFFATLNRTVKSYMFAIVGAEYVMRWLPRGTHQWNKFLRPSEINKHVSGHTLQLEDVTGMNYNPLNSSWSLGGDTSVNYLMLFSK